MARLGTVGGVGERVRTQRWGSHRYSVGVRIGSRGDALESERLADLFLRQHSDQDLAAADGDVVRDLGAALRLQTHITLASVNALQREESEWMTIECGWLGM